MDETLIKRVMPNSLEAEQSVVGAMILNQDTIGAVESILTRSDFYHQQFGALFEGIVELHQEGKPIDAVLLQNKLRQKDVPPEVASLEYLSDLATNVPFSGNASSYARVVKDKAILRKIIQVNQEIENACYEGKEDVNTIMERTENDVLSLLQSRETGEDMPIDQIVLEALDKIEQASQTSGNVTGLSTGFLDLDYKTAGLQPSDLILIAARPSMGKTAFVLNLAQNICLEQGKTAAIFSLEMSKVQLVNRIFSLESRLDAQKLRTGNLQDFEWEQLIEAAGIVGGSNMEIIDIPGISVSDLRAKCRKIKQKKGLDVIIIDYLQLMSGSSDKRSESRQNEIAEISRSLKAVAREFNVPVIALSQLSRAVEQRVDHRPMLSDLRESGSIEQDADVVMFLYRDEYYNHDSDRKGITEVNIAKQRNGATGMIELVWLPELTKFANKEFEHKEP